MARHPMPLPEKPGIGFSVDYFGPLPVTPRGNTYILLFIDRFSRRADMYAVTAAQFTAEGTANILINRYTPLWRWQCSTLSANGLQVCTRLSQATYTLLGVRKVATSFYHVVDNGRVERVNYTMARNLAMVVNGLQNHWGVKLPQTKFAYNTSISVATG